MMAEVRLSPGPYTAATRNMPVQLHLQDDHHESTRSYYGRRRWQHGQTRRKHGEYTEYHGTTRNNTDDGGYTRCKHGLLRTITEEHGITRTTKDAHVIRSNVSIDSLLLSATDVAPWAMS